MWDYFGFDVYFVICRSIWLVLVSFFGSLEGFLPILNYVLFIVGLVWGLFRFYAFFVIYGSIWLVLVSFFGFSEAALLIIESLLLIVEFFGGFWGVLNFLRAGGRAYKRPFSHLWIDSRPSSVVFRLS